MFNYPLLGTFLLVAKEPDPFPLPMTGETPRYLKDLVLNSEQMFQEIVLEPRDDDEERKVVGKGFVVKKSQEAVLESGQVHQWQEQWMISCSNAHAKRQKIAFTERLNKAYSKLTNLKATSKDTQETFRKRADKILETHSAEGYLSVDVTEVVTPQKKYIGRGRPGPKTPFEWVDKKEYSLKVDRNEEAIEQFRKLAGWRIFVTNEAAMSLNQSARYYRDEWQVERGFHRFKKGHIPALPLFLRIEERIKGLMLFLTIALQVLTLMEFVSRRELSKNKESISGLVPGNPKMKTARPTAVLITTLF